MPAYKSDRSVHVSFLFVCCFNRSQSGVCGMVKTENQEISKAGGDKNESEARRPVIIFLLSNELFLSGLS